MFEWIPATTAVRAASAGIRAGLVQLADHLVFNSRGDHYAARASVMIQLITCCTSSGGDASAWISQ